jgi:hypothetical protein
MTTFTVTKTVEYFYTIEADSAEQAESLASQFDELAAYQCTTLDMYAESDIEFEASIKGAA